MNEMIQKILNIIPTSSHSEPSIRAVLNRLTSFGYLPTEDDSWELSFVMMSVENHIKNSCNITSIPEGLFNVAADMICGEFLMNRKNSGRLDISDLDLSGAITSISEGDVSISFDTNATDEQKFNQLVSYLLTKGKGEFVCYRQLKW
ncbi:MAG: hypothetical protein IJZ16_01260 [Clostridia bacterium]|nr:hypothetical protein [Clostridia bacterium]